MAAPAMDGDAGGGEARPMPGGQRFPCPSCNADMAFDPRTSGLKCPYCGTEKELPHVPGAVDEYDLASYIGDGRGALARLSAQAMQVTCSGCGSTIAFEPPETAGECPFCGAKIVAQPTLADPLIAPQGVLPFAVPKKEAQSKIREWISTRWFAPNALKKMAQHDGIGGVYLPFWTYDAGTRSDYVGQRGEHYWETEHYTTTDSQGRTVRQSRQVQKTRWYPASGRVARDFDDIVVAATQSVDEGRLDALQPWDLEQVAPFSPAFLSGFKAQRYQVEVGAGFERAKQIMAGVIHSDVRHAIGGDVQRVISIRTDYFDPTFKHLLLPVWIAAYRFEGKVYQVTVNARTGEVAGERPYSVWKIAGAILLGLIAIALIVYFTQGQK
jgi:ribosomal protein S27E